MGVGWGWGVGGGAQECGPVIPSARRPGGPQQGYRQGKPQRDADLFPVSPRSSIETNHAALSEPHQLTQPEPARLTFIRLADAGGRSEPNLAGMVKSLAHGNRVSASSGLWQKLVK